MVRQVGAKLMEHILCDSYDKRSLTRRQLVRALATLTGAGAAVSPTAAFAQSDPTAAAPMLATTIDHLSIPWTIVNDDNRP